MSVDVLQILFFSFASFAPTQKWISPLGKDKSAIANISIERNTMSTIMPAMSMGQFAEFAAAVTQSLPRDIDPITAQKWIKERSALGIALREALVSPSMQRKQYPLRIDCARTLTGLLEDGHYEIVHPVISNLVKEKARRAACEGNPPNEQSSGLREVTAGLICFGRVISAAEAKNAIEALGLHNADRREFLVFGAQYPDAQRGFRIVGLSARVGGYDHTFRVGWGYYFSLDGDETSRSVKADISTENGMLKPSDRILVIAK